MNRRQRNIRLTTRVMLILMASFLCGMSCFIFFYTNRQNVYHFIKEAGIINFDGNRIMEEVRERVKNLNYNDYNKKELAELMGIDEYMDKYTGIFIYAGEQGEYQFGYMPQVLNEIIAGNIVHVGGDELYIREAFETELPFRDTKVVMLIYSYHIAIMIWPYMLCSILLSMLIMLIPVLVFIQWRMRYVGVLKDEIFIMSDGDLQHPVTIKGSDEIGILASELDQMRIALDENIQKEQETRKSNHDLISTMSHDLRTPMTTLYGYLEILEQKRCPAGKEEEYIRRCVRKVEEIRKLSDKMFEYALVYGQEEETDMEEIYVDELLEELGRDGEFLELKGYQVQYEMDCPGKIMGNRNFAQRIFNNLFSNIMKYADKSREVVIQAKPRKGKLKIVLINYICTGGKEAESNRIGLKSVQKMAELQQGSLYIAEEAGVFAVTLEFPLL